MKSFISLLFILLIALSSFAQLYTDASANLPDNGAKNASMDVLASDIDDDGDLDIILANEFQANTILINDGHAVFTKMTEGTLPQKVRDSEDVAIADFNGDGFEDLIFCSEDDINLGRINVHEYYLSDGNGKFIESTYRFPDSESNAIIAAYINQDSFPDVIFGNKGFNRIYINQGDGTFVVDAVALPEIQRTTQDLAMADVDFDGDMDLFAGNEDGNVLCINDGAGKFTDMSATLLPEGVNMETRKATFGDIDGDHDPDLFLSNVMFINGKNPQNRLYVNDGSGKFTDVTSTRLPADQDHTIDAIFEDIDLDDDLDIIIGNFAGARVKVYSNDGQGFFNDATDEIFGATYIRDALGIIAVDLNGDGLRDLYICDRYMAEQNKKDLLLLRNPVTAITEPINAKHDTHIYPNQITNEFFVETQMADLKYLQLLTLDGKLIDTLSVVLQQAGLYKGSVDNLTVPTGMYIMQVPGSKVNVVVMIKH